MGEKVVEVGDGEGGLRGIGVGAGGGGERGDRCLQGGARLARCMGASAHQIYS